MGYDNEMEEALNKQVNAEMYSSYLYLSMSASFESISLKGFAQWMKVQAQEEMAHAMKFYSFIFERGGKPELLAIDKPPSEWKTPLQAFEAVYKHEQKVTSMINALVDMALEKKDHATKSMLNWFIDEQVEEESSANEVVQKLKLIKDHTQGLFLLDKELGVRAFNATTAEK
jgi:ferritin